MNISKIKPIKIESQEALEQVEKATKSQSLSTSVPRTFDANYPMFSFETNNKHLVYVPNFYTVDEEGKKHLVMESAYVHPVVNGRQFMYLRSTQGLQGLEEFGISGDSPLMQATQECWELYNLKYKQVAEAMGVDPANDTGEVLKPKRIELLNQRVVKDPVLHHYFPIVVFETEKDPKTGLNTFKFVVDQKTKVPKFKICWMDVSESQWKEKWSKVLDSLDDGETIAGQLLSLNYNFTTDISKEKNPRRDSGRALNINVRPVNDNLKSFFAELDKLAKDWTPAKAREVIIACALFSDDEQREIVDSVMQETRMELNALKAMQLGVSGAKPQAIPEPQSPADALSNFGGVKTEEDNSDNSAPLDFGSSTGTEVN